MEKIKLSQPIIINGVETTDVVINFEQINGQDLINAEKAARAKGDTTPTVFLSMLYQAIVAAKLIGIKYSEFEKMPATDFKKILIPVASFLLN